MDKEEFVSTLAKRIGADAKSVSLTVDATLAELIAPSIFGAGGKLKPLADNNCGNGCGSAEAVRTAAE
jgi:hypothetical protein